MHGARQSRQVCARPLLSVRGERLYAFEGRRRLSRAVIQSSRDSHALLPDQDIQ